MRKRIIVGTVAVVAIFLIGFVPQYVKVSRVRSDLLLARQANTNLELRDLIGLAYVQASERNYGLAADTAARFFTRTREVANQTQDAAARRALEDLLVQREKIGGALGRGDLTVMTDLQSLYAKTRQATGASVER